MDHLCYLCLVFFMLLRLYGCSSVNLENSLKRAAPDKTSKMSTPGKIHMSLGSHAV